MDTPHCLAISVGNSRIYAGRFTEDGLDWNARFENNDYEDAAAAIAEAWQAVAGEPRAAMVLASVNDVVADPLAEVISRRTGETVYRMGTDLAVPIGQQLDPASHTGIDRLLNAAGAFDTLHQACVVVDVGTAVTVDFVDGDGVFHGGAIAPGAAMQLRAMHQQTTALPEVDFSVPDGEPFGRSTAEAMIRGVYHGIRGLVWRLTEQYATEYDAFPPVIVTGGDALALFENDELVDRIVPNLTLIGMAAAVRRALESNDDTEASSPPFGHS